MYRLFPGTWLQKQRVSGLVILHRHPRLQMASPQIALPCCGGDAVQALQDLLASISIGDEEQLFIAVDTIQDWLENLEDTGLLETETEEDSEDDYAPPSKRVKLK